MHTEIAFHSSTSFSSSFRVDPGLLVPIKLSLVLGLLV